jgi:AcrR family transcriptional regulator
MTAPSSNREVGRPRVYSDEAIFDAVHLLIRRDGYTTLTLEAIAHEVGCTRQALVRRFGSKRELLLASVDATAAKLSSEYDSARESRSSPLAALRDRMMLPPTSRPESATDAREQANLLAYVVLSSADPEFGTRFAALQRLVEDEIEKLLRAAVAHGELADVDITALAENLYAASIGETVNASTDASIDQPAMRAMVFEQIVGPYRRTPLD